MDKKAPITPEVKRIIAQAINSAAMNEVITKKHLGECFKMSSVYFSQMLNEKQWEKMPPKFWEVMYEWYTEDPRQALRTFALRRENNSKDHNHRVNLETLGAVEEVKEEPAKKKPWKKPEIKKATPEQKKKFISGTAHRTGKKNEGKISADINSTGEESQSASVTIDNDSDDKSDRRLVKESELIAMTEERDNLNNLLITEKEVNEELRTSNSTLSQSLSSAKESLDTERELAADWQRLAKLNEDLSAGYKEQLDTLEKTAIELEERIERLTAPGKVLEQATNIQYHYMATAEGQVKGPMARIMEAIAELEALKCYVTVDVEYDTPAGKHDK